MRTLVRSLAVALAAAVCFVAASISPLSVSAEAREVVAFDARVAPGTIIVRTNERRLYLVLGQGRAMRYVVGVGRAGRQWSGKTFIEGKYIRPDWSPPPDIRRDMPHLPKVIPGGSPRNPMGFAALTFDGGTYAIHGTNEPKSIGGFVSYGCIRMHNRDVADLFNRVGIGTPVIVTR